MWQSIKKLFKSNYLFTFGVIICLFWILMAILAPVLAPYDPVAQDLTIRLQPPVRNTGLVRTISGRIFSAVCFTEEDILFWQAA